MKEVLCDWDIVFAVVCSWSSDVDFRSFVSVMEKCSWMQNLSSEFQRLVLD